MKIKVTNLIDTVVSDINKVKSLKFFINGICFAVLSILRLLWANTKKTERISCFTLKLLNLVFFCTYFLWGRGGGAQGGTFSLSANYAKYFYIEDNAYATSNHKFQFEYQLYPAC